MGAGLSQGDDEQPPRVVFRIVRSDPPTENDFRSRAGLGLGLLVDTALGRELHEGLSVLSSEAEARSLAKEFPSLGRFVAVLRVPEGARLERTLRRAGHWTIWADAQLLLDSVAVVVPVD